MRAPHPIRGFLALTSFLTIIPTRVHDIAAAASSLYMAPLVGLIVGALSAAPLITYPRVPALAAAISYALTGFLHLEGLADFADAALSGARGDEFIRILKDPRRGGKAVAAVAVAVAAVFTLTHQIASLDSPALVYAAGVAGAYESLYIGAFVGEPPPYEGLSSLFVPKAREALRKNLAVVAVTAAALALSPRALAAYLASIAASSAAALTVTRASMRAAGFVNGDVLGACLEVGRVASLAAAAVVGYA